MGRRNRQVAHWGGNGQSCPSQKEQTIDWTKEALDGEKEVVENRGRWFILYHRLQGAVFLLS